MHIKGNVGTADIKAVEGWPAIQSASIQQQFSMHIPFYLGSTFKTCHIVCICSFEECDATFKGVQRLFGLVCSKLPSEALSTMNMLKSAISLLFCSCKKCIDFSPDSAAAMVRSGIKEMWKRLYQSLLDDFFVYHYSPKFGNPDDKRKKFQDAQSDIKVRWCVFPYLFTTPNPHYRLLSNWQQLNAQ